MQYQSLIATFDPARIPLFVEETLQNINWVGVINYEMKALEYSLEIFERLGGQNPFECNWFYTVKKKKVAWHSWSLQGTSDKKLHSDICQILLSFIVSFGWELQQFDVKNLFFHEDLYKECIWRFS